MRCGLYACEIMLKFIPNLLYGKVKSRLSGKSCVLRRRADDDLLIFIFYFLNIIIIIMMGALP